MELKKKILFSLYLLALIIYRIYGYSGHFGFDDMEYAEMSHQLLLGEADFSNHFTYRFSIIFPTAISYFLFGINDWSSSFPTMVASALVLLLVYRLLRKESIATISIALTMTLFSEWFLFYSNKLMVDVYVCLGILSIIYSLYQIRFQQDEKTTKYAILFALSLIFSFMAKGTVILILPLLLFLFIHDIFHRRHILFWKKSIILSSLVLMLYFILIHFLTGDFTSRFSAIESNGYINRCSYVMQESAVFIKRITRDFFEMLRNEGPARGFVFVISALLFGKKLHFLSLKTPLSFFLICSFILFLSSNFMSISLNGYNPMCIDLRHYLWLIPISAIATSLLIQQISTDKKFLLLVLISLGLLCLNTFLSDSKLLWKLYIPLSTLFLVFALVKNQFFRKTIFPTLFASIFMIQPFYISSNARRGNYNAQVDFIKETLIHSEGKKVIFTDKVQARIGYYLTGFDDSKIQFRAFNEVSSYLHSDLEKKILLNPYTHFFAGTNPENYPFYVKHIIEAKKPSAESDEIGIRVYDLEKLVEPELTGKKIIKSSANFKSASSGWSINSNNLTDSVNHSGQYSEKLSEYSSTFKLQLNELSLDSTKNLYIKISANTLVKRTSTAALVVSIGDGNNNSFWKGFDIEPFQQVHSNWWTIDAYTILPVSKIQPQNSELSFYLWNKDKQEIWLDDISIEIYEY
ncbi:MAG: glycosyltransferase family 39 protein [Flavobacteriales bacterium]|nr:glycosyltransferase family 39 protein [Flavobacteriales bacterium]